MSFEAQIRSSVISIARTKFGAELQRIELASSTARGGLESRAVRRVRIRGQHSDGRTRSLSVIAKRLDGFGVREAHVYRDLLSHLDASIAPHVFGLEPCADTGAVMFLEDVRTAVHWPWRDTSSAAAVLQKLAVFHETSGRRLASMPSWDYEAMLHESAVATLETLQRLRRDPEFAWMRRSLRPIARLVTALSRRRADLMSLASYAGGAIHGDVHPGNVILRTRGGRREPILIDWARARTGSALEDVSSWLQTLAYWEPEARRRHDTLLKCYLRARGREPRLSSEFREAYWTAAASNALAGALRYYCWKAETSKDHGQRARAMHAARDWIRMLERADALSQP